MIQNSSQHIFFFMNVLLLGCSFHFVHGGYAVFPKQSLIRATSRSPLVSITSRTIIGKTNLASWKRKIHLYQFFQFLLTNDCYLNRCHYRIDGGTIRQYNSNNIGETNDPSEPDSESSTTTTTSTSSSSMDNIYQQWTVDDDILLFEHRNESLAKLASMLGRGLRGVESRLEKLCDVNSSAYHRLFVEQQYGGKRNKNDIQKNSRTTIDDNNNNNNEIIKKKKKLIPASEVLRRIQWDQSLCMDDFFILHYDRVDDTIVQSCVNAPNESISGRETLLINALPEHRIVAIKYKERIVWDRNNRIDLVFTSNDDDNDDDQSGGGGSSNIYKVIETYTEWKQQMDNEIALKRQRYDAVLFQLQQILGLEYFNKLNELTYELQQQKNSEGSNQQQQQRIAEQYVTESLDIFRHIRNNPMNSINPQVIPMSDYDALDVISQYVSVVPDLHELQNTILVELELRRKRIGGGSGSSNSKENNNNSITDNNSKKKELKIIQKRPLPDINEDDIEETFVRGSGPGGQKINKTSNRVVLVHIPTQIRVECQETRSLPQNRKIARKRLQQKLDDYYYGSSSKTAIATTLASMKKAKSKARSRARIRQKQQQQQQYDQTTSSENDNQSNDDEFV